MKAMKSMILCLVLLCGAAVLGAQAPEWQWAVNAGGPNDDYGQSIAIDSQGNQYVAGHFRDTATFGSHTLTASGLSSDIFVAKLDPCGNWLWAVRAGGTFSDEVNGIAVDGTGNAYVTGVFYGTATFGSHTLTASGRDDIFTTKIDSSGNWLWAVRAGGTGNDVGYSIAVDGEDNACLTGSFFGSANFGSDVLTASGGSYDYDVFVAMLDSYGNWLWVVQAGGTHYYPDEGRDITVDGVGNIYVTGRFSGTAAFGSQTLTASGGGDIFVAKLDPSGNWLWAVQAGGIDYDCGLGIAVDGEVNTWVTGYFQGTASFGNQTLTASGGGDIFVAKLDSSGNWLWAVKAGGTNYNTDMALDITLDGTGNAYVTGRFGDTAAFGSHTLISYGIFDIFVAKLDPDGNWLWAVQAGGTSNNWGCGIALDGEGNAWVTGNFLNLATFGSHTLTSNGSRNIFVAKLGSGTPVEEELALQTVAKLYNAYPNPLGRGESALIKTDIPERSSGTLSIFNLRGQIVARHKLGPGPHQISFGGGELPSGVYLYSLQCGNHRETKKLVLLK